VEQRREAQTSRLNAVLKRPGSADLARLTVRPCNQIALLTFVLSPAAGVQAMRRCGGATEAGIDADLLNRRLRRIAAAQDQSAARGGTL
jgi:hypothetical protein